MGQAKPACLVSLKIDYFFLKLLKLKSKTSNRNESSRYESNFNKLLFKFKYKLGKKLYQFIIG
jgi:hypothetical protein